MDSNFLAQVNEFNSENLPSLLVDSNPFDLRQIPFSPTSPGKRSPGRPKTMKEYEEDLANLQRENFNLKIKIYFMEQNRADSNLPKDVDELRNALTDLKVEFELQKKDLANKEDLLLKSYRALDTQKLQLEAMKNDFKTEKQDLQAKVEALEKELKEYHIRFFNASIQPDDTDGMYTLPFGLKSENKPDENNSEEKVKELENDLSKEKERILILEEKISGLNSKIDKDQQHFKQLHEQVMNMEEKLRKTLKERNEFEESVKEATYQIMKLEKNLQRRNQALNEKESQIEHMKTTVKQLQEELSLVKYNFQEKEKISDQNKKAYFEMQKKVENFVIENTTLKHELKRLEQKAESKTSREWSSGHRRSDQERELARQLRESQIKVEELYKQLEELKRFKERCSPGDINNLVQNLFRENKLLKRDIEALRTVNRKLSENHTDSFNLEGERSTHEVNKKMSEKDALISELQCEIEEMKEVICENECRLQEYKIKLDSTSQNEDSEHIKIQMELKNLEDHLRKQEKEKEDLSKQLEDKNKEVESLKKELKKKTYNLQGLVNTELWDKNREIEKLNKVCERKHLEVMSLEKRIREYQLASVQDKVTCLSSPLNLQSGHFGEDKENLQPGTDPMIQLQNLLEEKRSLVRKVEELQARLLNTPERDTESLLVHNLRAERDQAEKLRKEAVNACMLLTTRLQELADFLDSLLPSLCGKKRRVVQQAVERSRELSRSLSLAAEESTLLQCSAWSDLQPSLYVPLLPDISTVDFWSGDECQEEPFCEGEEVSKTKSRIETITEVNQNEVEKQRFQSEKMFGDSILLKSVCNDENKLLENIEMNSLLEENNLYGNIVDIAEASLFDISCSDQHVVDKTQGTKLSSEVKSANIGKITLTSKKKDSTTSLKTSTVEVKDKQRDKNGDLSEYETWSEPDRDVSYARMGLKEDTINVNKSLPINLDDTSETADPVPKSPSSKRIHEIQRLQRKVRSLEQVNEALRSELIILHQLAPPALSRQDKATSIEFSRQNNFHVPSHLLEEIRNQREKLEASLFHNDYIRRQLENTVSSLRRSQGEDFEKISLLRLKEVTDQLETAESELSVLKLEKEQLGKKVEMLQTTIQQNSNELIEKQCAMLELEDKTAHRIKEVEDNYNKKYLQAEEKFLQMEKKWLDLQEEKDKLVERISGNNETITRLSDQIEIYVKEGKKNKTFQDDLNVKLKQISLEKNELQRVVAEQEQLLADAERERQELATQLIARDRQVSDLQKRLSHVELTSNELEAALRSQLDIATHQCAQFESKLRELDTCNKQVAQVERIKCELERRVAELEAVNSELETKLASLNMKPAYSDCENDAGSCVVGSPHHPCVTPLKLPASPPLPTPCYSSQRSQDLTSDYLSDQDAVLTPSQSQTQNLWFSTSPHSHMSTSPDLGIDSDHGRFSSIEMHGAKSTVVSTRCTPVKDLLKLEEENTQLRRNLQKTRHALEETLSQLTAANQHKRQYEAQLNAANQHKVKVERAICRQLHKTHSILKKARVNLEDNGKGDH